MYRTGQTAYICPLQKKIPQYYDEVGLPMALDIIEVCYPVLYLIWSTTPLPLLDFRRFTLSSIADSASIDQGKLSRQEYPNLSGLEGDLKRMISNAKSFNAKASPIFSDAEKIRKAVSAFMNERNPAYKTPGYQAVPTPVPEGWQKKVPAKVPIKENSPEPTEEKGAIQEEPSHGKRAGRKPGRAPASVSASVGDDRRASSTPAVQDAEGAGQGFEGNTFQQAQDKIITELMNLTDDEYVEQHPASVSRLPYTPAINSLQQISSICPLAACTIIID